MSIINGTPDSTCKFIYLHRYLWKYMNNYICEKVNGVIHLRMKVLLGFIFLVKHKYTE